MSGADPLHGLPEVRGQGKTSVVVWFIGVGVLGNHNHTGGLPHDWDSLQTETWVKNHLTELGLHTP